METNVIVGVLLIVVGLSLYLQAEDFLSSLPGNFAFFSGVIVATWGASHELFKGLFYLAIASLALIVISLAVFIYKAKHINERKP